MIDGATKQAEAGPRATPRRAWRRLSVATWLAIAVMTVAIVYTQSGAGMHWWTAPSHSTYEIENYGFPFIGVMQCWMTELMTDDLTSRVEVWDWYPWALAMDVPLGLLMIASTGVVVERLVRSRGQVSLAGILALTATIATLVALWLNAPAILALARALGRRTSCSSTTASTSTCRRGCWPPGRWAQFARSTRPCWRFGRLWCA